MDSCRCPRFQWICLNKWSCCSFRHGSAAWNSRLSTGNSRIRSCNKKLKFLVTRVFFIHLHMTSLQNKHQHIALKKHTFWFPTTPSWDKKILPTKTAESHGFFQTKSTDHSTGLLDWWYGVGILRPSFFWLKKNQQKLSVRCPTCNITGRNSSPLSTCKGAAAMVTWLTTRSGSADKKNTIFIEKKHKNRDSQSQTNQPK